jgi:hypothetical protein
MPAHAATTVVAGADGPVTTWWLQVPQLTVKSSSQIATQ